MLAALAISIGIAAIWGYQQIKTEASTAAKAAVTEQLQKSLDSVNIRAMIKAELDLRVEREANALYEDVSATSPAEEEDKRQVGDIYPEEGEKK